MPRDESDLPMFVFKVPICESALHKMSSGAESAGSKHCPVSQGLKSVRQACINCQTTTQYYVIHTGCVTMAEF